MTLDHGIAPKRAIDTPGSTVDPRLAAVLPIGAFLACLSLRSPGLLVHPRFWAEEGNLYYGKLQAMSPLKGLVRVLNGNYQFLTNAFVEVALRFPVRWAGAVTTYLGLGAAMLCCWLMARLLLSRGCSAWTACLACGLFALQPGGYEVFLNATNVQWVSSVIGLLLCLSEEVPAAGPAALLSYGGLLVCGMTGTPTCILLPLFVIGAVWRRTTFGWTMAIVLGAATAAQASIVLAHHGEMSRVFALSAYAPLPLVFQVFFTRLLPVALVNDLGVILGEPTTAARIAACQIVVVGLGGLAVVASIARGRLGIFVTLVLALGMAAIPLINEFGALSSATGMLSGLSGGRYFFLGSSCFIVLLAAGADATSSLGRKVAAILLVLVVSNSLIMLLDAPWTGMFLEGPSFSEQVDACVGLHTCKVVIWPAGGQWAVDIAMPGDR